MKKSGRRDSNPPLDTGDAPQALKTCVLTTTPLPLLAQADQNRTGSEGVGGPQTATERLRAKPLHYACIIFVYLQDAFVYWQTSLINLV
jgi:hypothetical protein